MLARMYQKRLKTYAKLGYEVYAAESGEQSDQNILIEPASAINTLIQDITGAAKNIFIAAPYASSACLAELADVFRDAIARGIVPEIYIASTPQEDAKEALSKMDAEYVIRAEGRLCAAIIDEEIIWYGTIPLLAFPKKEDCSIRFKNSEVAAELIDEIRQKGESEVAPANGTLDSCGEIGTVFAP